MLKRWESWDYFLIHDSGYRDFSELSHPGLTAASLIIYREHDQCATGRTSIQRLAKRDHSKAKILLNQKIPGDIPCVDFCFVNIHSLRKCCVAIMSHNKDLLHNGY